MLLFYVSIYIYIYKFSFSTPSKFPQFVGVKNERFGGVRHLSSKLFFRVSHSLLSKGRWEGRGGGRDSCYYDRMIRQNKHMY